MRRALSSLVLAVVSAACGPGPATSSPGGDAGIFLQMVSGSPQAAPVGTVFTTPLGLRVLNTDGGTMSGLVVHFTAPQREPSALWPGMSRVQDVTASGSGTVLAPPLTAGNLPGTYVVTATVDGSDDVLEFQLTNMVGPPASVQVTQGDDQTAAPGAAFSTPFKAVLRDAKGNLVPMAMVTFITPSDTGVSSCTFAGDTHTSTVTTDENGVAEAPACMANNVTGDFTVQVQGPLQSITDTLELHISG